VSKETEIVNDSINFSWQRNSARKSKMCHWHCEKLGYLCRGISFSDWRTFFI